MAGLEDGAILKKSIRKITNRNKENQAKTHSWIKIFGRKTNNANFRVCLVGKNHSQRATMEDSSSSLVTRPCPRSLS